MTDLNESVVGRIYDRTDWGAPATPGGAQRDPARVVGMTVHHTTGNTLGNDDTVRWWHNIWRWHTGRNPSSPLTWSDIGYAYGIDRFGNLFVGRGRYRQLAHARGYNTTWLGVAYLGSGIQGHVTIDAKQTFVGLRNWLRDGGGMDNMSRLNGHRDIGSTACPGDHLYQWVSDGMPTPDTVGGGLMLPRQGDTGEVVEFWQRTLVRAGYPIDYSDPYDGNYGPATEAAVTKARQSFSSNVTPSVGRITPWTAMRLLERLGGEGAEGPRGPRGPKGDRGPKGERGPAGTDGKDADLTDYAIPIVQRDP